MYQRDYRSIAEVYRNMYRPKKTVQKGKLNEALDISDADEVDPQAGEDEGMEVVGIGAAVGRDVAPEGPLSPSAPEELAPDIESDDETQMGLGGGMGQSIETPFADLINQVMSKIESANNLTPQEIDNVRATLEKATFDAAE